jgi:hypothetical protein
MCFHFRENVRHDSWVCKVGLDVQISVTHRSVFNTASCCCDLVPGAGELVGDEGAGARTDAEDEYGGLGRHVEIPELRSLLRKWKRV